MVRALDLHGYEFESLPYGDFSIFQDGGRRHLGFLIFLIFNGGNGQECRTTLLCQILSKSLEPRSRYRNVWIFKMAADVILDFKIFNGRTRQEGRTTSVCQISTKSLQSRTTCGDFLLFKMAAAAIFDFFEISDS